MSGHDVSTAANGEEAVTIAELSQPDIVFLDIGMPGIGGIEAARQIRLRAQRPKPVLVALTGWGQDSDRLATLDAGFDHHLMKPVNLDTLNQVIDLRLHEA